MVCLTIQNRTPPWWSCLLGPAVWLWGISQYPCGSRFGRGWPRRYRRVLFNYAHDVIFFFVCSIWLLKWRDRAPPHTFQPSHAPSLTPLLLRMPTFDWLLCFFDLTVAHLRPRCNIFSFFFNSPFDCKNEGTAPPPHVPPWPHALTNTPLTENANFWLVVVFDVRTAAT